MNDYHAAATIVVNGPADRVREAWTCATRLAEWFPERVDGELEPGGQVRFSWPSFGVAIDLEVARGQHGALTFRGAPGGSLQHQHLTIEAIAPNRARVHVHHNGLANPDEAAGTEAGWSIALSVLREYVERYWACPRSTFAVLTATAAPASAIADRIARPRWLDPRAPVIDTPGLDFALRIDELVLTGTVLAATRHNTAVRCDSIDGVITLRALASAPGLTIVGVHVSSWAPSCPALPALRRALEGGIERLAAELGAP